MKGLHLEYIKNSHNSIARQPDLFKKGVMQIFEGTSSKKVHECPVSMWKDAQNHDSSGK